MKQYVWFFILLALLLRLILLFATPLTNQPAVVSYFNDELAHYNYVRYIDKYGKLPIQTSSVQDGIDKGDYEYYQAPLYYELAQPFYSLGHWLTPGREHYWIRFISVILSIAGLAVLYPAVQRFWAKSEIAIFVLMLGATGGVPLRFGSLVTNDSLLFAIACLYFAVIVHVLCEECDRRFFGVSILIAATGLWTKASFIVMLPLLPVVIMISGNRSFWRAASTVIVPLICILPWYARNLANYGRIIPLEVGFGAANPVTGGNLIERAFWTANYFVRSFVFPYDGLWGGSLDVAIYPVAGLALLVFLVVGFMYLYRTHRTAFWVFLLALLLNMGSYLSFNLLYFQAEARLLLPSLPFILTLIIFGAYRITGYSKRGTLIILALWVALPWVGAVV